MAFNLNKFYSWCIGTCNAKNVGYSMTYRNQRTINGVTFYDCSSFVWYGLIAGGATGLTGWPMTTYNEASVLTGLGWHEVSASGTYKPGDIGLSTSHTEVCYKGGQGNGIFMGAHDNFIGGWGINLNNLQNQVSIGSSSGNANYRRSFPRLFRYGSGGAEDQGAEDPGLSIYVIAAICGNFWQESGINPGIWESLKPQSWDTVWHDNQGGYGLGQWTNTNGDSHGRLWKLHQYLQSHGYADDSMEGQLAYIVEENVWQKGTSYQQAITFKNLQEFLHSGSTDIDYLTKAWLYCWEGIANDTLSIRQQHARQCLEYIREHANDTSITTYYKDNNYLSEAQILNNAVMLYRLMNAGGGGGGGTAGRVKGKMPVWMMIRYGYF